MEIGLGTLRLYNLTLAPYERRIVTKCLCHIDLARTSHSRTEHTYKPKYKDATSRFLKVNNSEMTMQCMSIFVRKRILLTSS